jgi:hypothetical protein
MTRILVSRPKSTTTVNKMSPRSSEESDVDENDPLVPNDSVQSRTVQQSHVKATTSQATQTPPGPESTGTLASADSAAIILPAESSTDKLDSEPRNEMTEINLWIGFGSLILVLVTLTTIPFTSFREYASYVIVFLCILGPLTAAVNYVHQFGTMAKEVRILALLNSPGKLEDAELLASLRTIREKRAKEDPPWMVALVLMAMILCVGIYLALLVVLMGWILGPEKLCQTEGNQGLPKCVRLNQTGV